MTPSATQRLDDAGSGAGVTGALGGAPQFSSPGAALDYEASYCPGAVAPAPLIFSTTLSVRAGFLGPVVYPVRVIVTDQPEAAVLAVADGASLDELGVSSNLGTSQMTSTALLLNDNGDDPDGTPRFIVCTQDISRKEQLQSLVQFSPFPLEGPSALPVNLTVPAFFVPQPLSSPRQVLLRNLPGCAAAFRAVDPLRAAVGGAANGTAHTWAQVFTLKATPAARAIPARALTLLLRAAPGNTSGSPPLALRVQLTRRFPGFSTAAADWCNLDESVHEKLPAGTVIGTLSAAADTPADHFEFAFAGSFVSSCNTYFPPDLFSLAPIAKRVTSVDTATGRNATISVSQEVRLVLARDSLDLDGAGSCTLSTFISVSLVGDFSATHALLPPYPAVKWCGVSVTITPAPSFTRRAVYAVIAPPGGLSVAGGDIVELVGAELGLPDAPGCPSNCRPPLFAALTDNATLFDLRSCAVATRMTRVRCTTSAGWLNASSPALSVRAKKPDEVLTPTLPRLRFAAAQPLAAAPSPPLLQATTWAALLEPPPPFANASAALSAVAPPPGGAWFDVAAPLSRAALAALSQRNFSLLLGNAPRGLPPHLCLSVAVVLLLEDASALPLGFCEVDAAASAVLAAGGGGPGAVAALGRLAANATAASAAVLNCPAPPLSGGAWRAVGAHGEVLRAGAGVGRRCAWAPEEASAPAAPAVLQEPFRSAAASALARLAGGAPRPSIASVTQAALGGPFTVTGDFLGAPEFSKASDVVEYAAVGGLGGACGAAAAWGARPPGTPCGAVLRARGCLYVPPTSLHCTLDPEGWGSGLSVRVVVGGQASAWSGGNISYAAPSALRFEVLSPPGALPASLGLLPPAGGGLLRLFGAHLWPHRALRVAIGGVPLRPVDARPLPAMYPAAAHNTSCAAAAARGLLPPAAAGCFGSAAAEPWPPPQPPAVTSLLLTTPPGFGIVFLDVEVEGLPPTRLPIRFSDPELTDIKLIAQVFNRSDQSSVYTLSLSGFGLSPCFLCFARGAAAASICKCSSSAGALPAAAAAAPKPDNASGEGALPAPLSPRGAANPACELSLSACALPDAWPSRNAASFPSATLGLVSEKGVSLPPPEISAAYFFAPSDISTITLTTPEKAGRFILALTDGFPGASAVFSRSLSYNLDKLSSPFARTNVVRPSLWLPRGGELVNITAANLKLSGSVRVFTAVSDQPIECPIVPSTIITFTAEDGARKTQPARAWTQFDGFLAGGAEGAHYYLAFAGGAKVDGTWLDNGAPLPCYVESWEGAERANPVLDFTVAFWSPAWVGGSQVGVMNSDGFWQNTKSVSSLLPTLVGAAVESGAAGAAGRGSLTVRGSNFGLRGSLGALWNAASPLCSNATGVSCMPSGFGAFFLGLKYPGDTALRRCPVISWADSEIRCTLPEGIAGSNNNAVLLLNWTVLPYSVTCSNVSAGPSNCKPRRGAPPIVQTSTNSLPVQFRYAPPCLAAKANVTELPQDLVPERFSPRISSGIVTLTGAGLSRFVLSRQQGVNESSEARRGQLRAASVSELTGEDAAGGEAAAPFFRPLITIEGAGGGGAGRAAGSAAPYLLKASEILLFSHERVVFIAPLLEGTVTFTLSFPTSDGAPADELGSAAGNCSSSASFEMPRPEITRIATVKGAWGLNPCADLNTTAEATDRDEGGVQKCVARFQSIYVDAKGAPITLPAPDPLRPCVATTLSRDVGFRQVLLSGKGFGTSGDTAKVYVLSAAFFQKERTSGKFLSDIAEKAEEPFVGRCSAISAGSVLLSPTEISCVLTGNLLAGDIVVAAYVAYTWIESPNTTVLQGACPCGTYGAEVGAPCARCPEGAVCGGALTEPRADREYWKTIPAEWAARGVPTAGVAPFVKCPTPILCTGSQNCVVGASGWACSRCDSGYARGYDGLCSRCSILFSVLLMMLLFIGAPVMVLLLIYFRVPQLAEARCCPRLRPYFQSDPAGAPLLDPSRGNKPRVPEPIQWRVMIKVLLTFMQTFGSLASFTSSSRLRRVFKADFQLLPNVLEKIQVFSDLGLNASYFKCLSSLDPQWKVLVYILLPVTLPPLAYALVWAWKRAGLREPPFSPATAAVFLEVLLIPIAVAGMSRAQDCMDSEFGGLPQRGPPHQLL
jgi:hypothetical protein